MKKIVLIITLSTILFSCGNSSKFKFEGNWKSDMGPNFGMPSTLIITKDNDTYSITLDNKKFTGTLNKKNGRLNFRGYVLTYDKSKDEIELLPYNSIYKRK